MEGFFEIFFSQKGCVVRLLGSWGFDTPRIVLVEFERMVLKHRHVCLDFSGLNRMSFGVIFFIFSTFQKWKISYEIQGAGENILMHIRTFESLKKPSYELDNSRILSPSTQSKGTKFREDFVDFLNFSGLILYYLYRAALNPLRLRWKPFFYYIHESCFKALPVALITSFVVSAAVSFQGVIQLQSMGAPAFLSVDTTAKLALREIGPFILALVIAGRSSSSYTAQIGMMNITDEISAMRVMNFHVIEFLVLPRFLALVFMMPFMVFLSDAASILAGMFIMKIQLNMGVFQYLDRFYETVGWSHFLLGIIKAPFFGAVIAMIGCFRGLQVQGDTETIGKTTTISVVNALFWCIFINAVFSVIFTKLDL